MSGRLSEDSLIARYFAPLAAEGGLGLMDDAACLTPRPDHDLVLTTDSLVEAVHFFPDDAAGSIARKALGVNVSDLAAKGAEPTGFLLNLALPPDWTEAWLADFAAGLGAAARDFACPLLGGDTVRTTGPLTLSITALGEVPRGRMVKRTSAQVGDAICVSGTIGDAALGLALRRSTDLGKPLPEGVVSYLVDRYLHPQPRHRLAKVLRDHASAAMDVSDGLVGDLAKMMRASGVSAMVDLDRVPLSEPARLFIDGQTDRLDRALTGGDDYEILCTVSQTRLDSFRKQADSLGIPITVIGQVVSGDNPPVFRLGGSEKRYDGGSYSHF
ncbi:thiamine-phosphate kinase [Microvirga antarctica]|uniref:thiamine-phosphate kinase n=1 Tax=Microvirga antarctica TaxID=2819233 RepID=UPI001B3112E5|nr:thiamine-phosphate kinase [Microvirga antarctica]